MYSRHHNLLRSQRRKTGATLSDIAAVLDVPDSSLLSKVELGQTKASLATIMGYMQLTGATLDQLYPQQWNEVSAKIITNIPTALDSISKTKGYKYKVERVRFWRNMQLELQNSRPERWNSEILSLFPTSTGYGYAIFRSPDDILDCGVYRKRTYDSKAVVKSLQQLMLFYVPEAIILRKEDPKHRKLSKRIHKLQSRIKRISQKADILTESITYSEVVQHWKSKGAHTKEQIIEMIYEQFPEYSYRTPRFRYDDVSEDDHMNVFEAIAQGIAWYERIKE